VAVPAPTSQIITVVVAVYAAVVATITGAVQIFNYRRDRSRIKLAVGHNMRIMLDPRYVAKNADHRHGVKRRAPARYDYDSGGKTAIPT
jgi:hypothetical protein